MRTLSCTSRTESAAQRRGISIVWSKSCSGRGSGYGAHNGRNSSKEDKTGKKTDKKKKGKTERAVHIERKERKSK